MFTVLPNHDMLFSIQEIAVPYGDAVDGKDADKLVYLYSIANENGLLLHKIESHFHHLHQICSALICAGESLAKLH